MLANSLFTFKYILQKGRLFWIVMLTKDNSFSTETVMQTSVLHTTKTQELTPKCIKCNFTLMIGPTCV